MCKVNERSVGVVDQYAKLNMKLMFFFFFFFSYYVFARNFVLVVPLNIISL